MEEIEKDLISTKAAMEMLRCKRTKLWELAKEGKIIMYKLTARSVFYSQASIREFIKSCRVAQI